MSAPNWEQVKQVFQDALERPPEQRAAYVQEQCGADRALQTEIQSLLAAHADAGSFGARPPIEFSNERALASDSGTSALVRPAMNAGDRLGVYEIQAFLDSGGMGDVYKARDTRLDRIVAIKVLPAHLAADRERYERFEREARAVAHLDHPHVGALYDVGQDSGLHFLVMQFLDGETLAARLTKGALPLDQVLRYATDIADALHHAHRRGIVHRDIKPGNIVLTKGGAILFDFGLAKWRSVATGLAGGLTAAATGGDSLTEKGAIVGTLHYMAPEQVEGIETDSRTDLFALGAVVYEMITGRKAFSGGSSASVLAAILDTQPPPISTLRPLTPPALDHVVRTCLAKDPEERWQSAGDVARELRWITESAAQLMSPQALWPSRWNRAVLLVGVIGLLAAGVLGVVLVSSIRERAAAPAKVTRTIVQTIAPLSNDNANVVALSPDGTSLAYVVDRGRTTQIYLRQLAELDAKPVAGTEDGDGPFFSPDGRWLGFSADGKLKKVLVSGSVPQTICEGDSSFGATWGPDDTIVFPSGWRTGLYRVAASGGKPQVLTTVDPSAREKSHRFPQFVAGGRSVLFTIITSDMTSFDEARLAVFSVETGKWHVLLDGGTNPRFVSTGHLLYVRGASLVAVPFDPRHLEITGQPAAVLDGVSAPSSNGAVNLSVAENGSVAFVRRDAGASLDRVVWTNREGRVEPLIDTPRPFVDARMSPHGQQLAVGIYGANDQVWLYDLGRRTLSRLTVGWDNNHPRWTPDGRRVVFRSDRAGAYNLYWQAADGSGPAERLTESPHDQVAASWTPDGRVLAFWEVAPTIKAEIWLLTVAPERRVRPLIQTPFNNSQPRISPDGHWLAYVSDETGQDEVYVQPFPALGAKRQISKDGGCCPRWASHERELFYLNGESMMAVEVQTRPTFTAGAARPLFAYASPNGVYDYDVAPDGRFITIQSAAPTTQITLIQNWFEELKLRVPK